MEVRVNAFNFAAYVLSAARLQAHIGQRIVVDRAVQFGSKLLAEDGLELGLGFF